MNLISEICHNDQHTMVIGQSDLQARETIFPGLLFVMTNVQLDSKGTAQMGKVTLGNDVIRIHQF